MGDTAVAEHIHVTERESAHVWPDGQKDDSHWEDCTFCAGVEWARLCLDADIPATHGEAEHLRDDAGEKPTGGTSIGDLIRGLLRRYKMRPGWWKVSGWAGLKPRLTPGTAHCVQGSMGAFARGHRLRRWDPAFGGGHCVLIIVLADGTLWWCDPLAPKGTYRGEKITTSELKAYVTGLSGGSSLGGNIQTKETASMDYATVTSKTPALIDVLPGAVLYELDGKTKIKALTGTYKAQVSPYEAGTLRAWYATIGGQLRPVLVKGASNIRAITDKSPFTQADLDSAKAAGVTAGTTAEKARIRAELGL